MVWAVKVAASIKNPAARMILVVLADAHNGKTGLCCPALTTLAEKAGYSVSAVKTALKDLKGSGLVTVHREEGRYEKNSYTLHFDMRGAEYGPLPGGQNLTSRRPESDFSDGQNLTSNQEKNNQEDNQHSARAENVIELKSRYSDDFETFWREYPKHEGKWEAFLVWKRLPPDDRLAAFDKAVDYAFQVEADKTEERYIPHACRWLKNRRWETVREVNHG